MRRGGTVHELYYWIALRLTFGIGNVLYKNLLQRFSSPERIFQASPAELESVEGITSRSARAIGSFRHDQAIDRELDRIDRSGVTVITFSAPEYPYLLRTIYDPPPLLYVRGTLSCRDRSAVAVVGSRSASEYGLRAAQQISRDLALEGITIVSGLARGIDSQAHRAALAAGGRTIAVLGSGIDVIYPPENERLYYAIARSGAVVSEYPMGTEPSSYNFPPRNRIISGLSAGVLVVEAGPKSGSLITARVALDQNRDVFAVPGSVYSLKSQGSHSLLRSGAKLVSSARDIIEELPRKSTRPVAEAGRPAACLEAEQQKVYDRLHSEPVYIDELLEATACSSSRLAALLLELELSGLVKQLPGKRFVRA
jgi:DNA processing protein